MKLVEIDQIISENPKKVYDIFYKYCFGHQENSVQVISYLIDNYIPKVKNKEDSIVYVIPRLDLDNRIFNLAKEAGAETFEGYRYSKFIENNESLSIKLENEKYVTYISEPNIHIYIYHHIPDCIDKFIQKK